MPTQPSASAPDALIHPVYARLLRLMVAQAVGASDNALAASHLVDAMALDGDRRLSRDAVAQWVAVAVAATGKPWLGLDLGGRVPVSAHGPLGYAAVTAPDLRACLAVLARYSRIRNDALDWRLLPTDIGMVLLGHERVALGAARSFVMDTVVAALLGLIETALGQWPAGLRVDLPVVAPQWLAHYARFSPVEIRFGQPALAVHVTTAALQLACYGADASAHAAACRDCERALVELGERSMAERAAQWLTDAPPGQGPQLSDLARHCQVSPRTLMRRLAAEGTSFQTLLDAARKARALWLLQHSSHSVEDIAAQLGYADTSNFSRTLRRWYGLTPRELRRQQGMASD